MREISKLAIGLVKHFEGFSSVVYNDVAGYPTIGYGHLLNSDESYSTITKQEAEELLIKDMTRAVIAVEALTKVHLHDNEFAALVSFVYNVGSGAYERSTLRMKLNRGEYLDAASEFTRWVYAGGKIIKGLQRRRREEKRLFLS